MPCTETYEFRQVKYLEKLQILNLNGICLSLVGKWCHLILSDSKGLWSNPKSRPSDRFENLDKKDVYTKIFEEQRAANSRLAQMRTDSLGLRQMVKVAEIMGEQNYLAERRPIVERAKKIYDELQIRADTIPQTVLSNLGCRKVSTPNTITWEKLATSFEAKNCYTVIFDSKSEERQSQHAIGIYMASGILDSDYYIFDPNHGEYKATDTTSTQRLLNTICKEYGNPANARVFHMQL